MILIPLETRTFAEREGFQLELVLDPEKTYEMAVVQIVPGTDMSDGIGTIKCDIVNPTHLNPHQILHRFSKYDIVNTPCYYKIDTFNLRRFTLILEGITATALAITIAIRECR